MSNPWFNWPTSLSRFVRFDSARAEDINDALDSVSVAFDSVSDDITRAIKLPVGSAEQVLDLTPVQRAGLILSFDADGNIEAIAGGGRWRGDWLTATVYVASDYFRDPVSKNIYSVVTQHTSGVLATDISSGKVQLAIDVETVDAASDAAVAAAATATTKAAEADASADNAAASEINAAASFLDFDKRYLGAKASDPTLDNQGGALINGALYFNTTVVPGEMRVYKSGAWEVAYLPVSAYLTASNVASLTNKTINDASNFVVANSLGPFNIVTAAVQTAVSGQRYSLQGTTTEGAATNLLLWSEQFNNAVWTKTGSSVTANSTSNPNGDLLADTLTNSAGAASLMAQAVTVSASSTNDYYASLFIKKGTSSTATLNVFYTGNTENDLTFNFDTGVLTGAAYPGESIAQFYGDGWWRIGFRILRDASASRTSIAFRIWESQRGTGVAGKTTYFWGAMLEAGATPTSYVISEGTQGVRSAGLVPPQRLVFPTSPAANAFVSVQIGNGLYTNVIHTNGQTFEGASGPLLLDTNNTGCLDCQFINGTWRSV